MASNYKNSRNTVARNVSLSCYDYDYFQRLYPHMFAKFVQRCVRCAVHDKEFFNSVFFAQSRDKE